MPTNSKQVKPMQSESSKEKVLAKWPDALIIESKVGGKFVSLGLQDGSERRFYRRDGNEDLLWDDAASRIAPALSAPVEVAPKNPSCPKCKQPLTKVRKSSSSLLNDDQFDAIRAGDWFCECHTNGRGNTSYAYFWDNELPQPETPAPKEYLPWAYAGGPNECAHGRAAGIACPECDRLAAPKVEDIAVEPGGGVFCNGCGAYVIFKTEGTIIRIYHDCESTTRTRELEKACMGWAATCGRITDTGTEFLQRAEIAEKRLAEAEELLREILNNLDAFWFAAKTPKYNPRGVRERTRAYLSQGSKESKSCS